MKGIGGKVCGINRGMRVFVYKVSSKLGRSSRIMTCGVLYPCKTLSVNSGMNQNLYLTSCVCVQCIHAIDDDLSVSG